MKKEMICIVCPRGCLMTVDVENNYRVTGNACPRGEVYGKKESIAPSRTLTTTVRLQGGALRRVPVKSKSELPKERILDAMRLLAAVNMKAPVRRGDTVIEDILGTGIDILITRDVPAKMTT